MLSSVSSDYPRGLSPADDVDGHVEVSGPSMVVASVASSVASRVQGLASPAGSFVHLLAGMWGGHNTHHSLTGSKGEVPGPVNHQLLGPSCALDGQSTWGNSCIAAMHVGVLCGSAGKCAGSPFST